MQRIYRISHDGGLRYVSERHGAWRLIDGDIFAEHEEREEVDPAGCRIHAPVHPSKIVAVGLNYKDHAAEVNKPLPKEPMLFIKPSTAVIGPDDEIVLPDNAGRIDHEAEVAVVIGRRASRVQPEDAARYVLGLTCLNDVTARELQARDIQYTRAKGFDTFAPIGPCIADGLDWEDVRVEGWVNDELRQASSTRQLIFPIATLVSFISHVMTLLPGDVIATGTPAGIGSLTHGDRVTIKVEGIGELTNTVRAANRPVA